RGLVNTIKIIGAGRNDLGGSNAAIEARFHDCSSSYDPNPLQPALFDGRTNDGNHVDNRKRRYVFESADTKMAGDRGHNDTAGTCGDEPVRQTLIYCNLRPGVVTCQMSKKGRRIGMNNSQLE